MGGQVVVELVVGDPVQRIPAKDGACSKSTANFINPLVVEGHPGRTARRFNCRRLDSFPESAIIQMLVRSNGVQMPAALLSVEEDSYCLSENGSLWRPDSIFVAAVPHDERADAEESCWEEV